MRAVYWKQPLRFYCFSFCAWLSSVSTRLQPASRIYRHPFFIILLSWGINLGVASTAPKLNSLHKHIALTIAQFPTINHALLYLQTKYGLCFPNILYPKSYRNLGFMESSQLPDKRRSSNVYSLVCNPVSTFYFPLISLFEWQVWTSEVWTAELLMHHLYN